MSERFDAVRFDVEHLELHCVMRKRVERLEELVSSLGPSRSASVALTKLEEFYMWVGKALRDHQKGGE